MKDFKTINDVEEWLEPMDYEGFWVAMEPYGPTFDTRAHCDEQIRQGASKDCVLDVMKGLVRIEITEKLGLQRRVLTPWIKLAVDNDKKY